MKKKPAAKEKETVEGKPLLEKLMHTKNSEDKSPLDIIQLLPGFKKYKMARSLETKTEHLTSEIFAGFLQQIYPKNEKTSSAPPQQDLDSKIDELKKEISSLTDEIKQLSEEKSDAEEKAQTLQTELAQKEQQLEIQRKELQGNIDDIRKQLDTARVEKTRLEERLLNQGTGDLKNDLKQALAEKETRLTQQVTLAEQKRSLDAKVENLQGQIEKLEGEKKQQLIEITEIKTKLSLKNQEHEKLTQEHQQLQNHNSKQALEDKQKRLKETQISQGLQKKLETAKAELARLEQQKEELDANYTTMLVEAQEKALSNQQLFQQLEQLEQQNKELKAKLEEQEQKTDKKRSIRRRRRSSTGDKSDSTSISTRSNRPGPNSLINTGAAPAFTLPPALPPPPSASSPVRPDEKFLSNVCAGAVRKQDRDLAYKTLVFMIATAGMDPNIKGGLQGNTGLHLAAANLNVEVVKLLVEHGAETSLLNQAGQTALDCILDPQDSGDRKKATEIREILQNPLEFTLLYQSIKALKEDDAELSKQNRAIRLLSSLTSVHLLHATDSKGSTLLHHACGARSSVVVIKLIDKANLLTWEERLAFVNAKDRQDRTPLHLALEDDTDNSQLRLTLEALIKNGANPRIESEAQLRPIDLAKKKFPEYTNTSQPKEERGRSTTRQSIRGKLRSLSRSRSRGRSSERNQNSEEKRKEKPLATLPAICKLLSDYSNQEVHADNLKSYLGHFIFIEKAYKYLEDHFDSVSGYEEYVKIWQLIKDSLHYKDVFLTFNPSTSTTKKIQDLLKTDEVTLAKVSKEIDKALCWRPFTGRAINNDSQLSMAQQTLTTQHAPILNKARRLLQNLGEAISFLTSKKGTVSDQVKRSAVRRFEDITITLYFTYLRQGQGEEALILLKSDDFPFINMDLKDPSNGEKALFVAMEYNPKDSIYGCSEAFMWLLENSKQGMKTKNSQNCGIEEAILQANNPLVRLMIKKVNPNFDLLKVAKKMDLYCNTFVHHCVLQAQPDLLQVGLDIADELGLLQQVNKYGNTPLQCVKQAKRPTYTDISDWAERLDQCAAMIRGQIKVDPND